MARGEQTLWWREAGSEVCELCLQLHHYEEQRRCAACDRGLCSVCVVIVRESAEVWCPGCAPPVAATAEGR